MSSTSQRKGSCKPCRERGVECDERKPRCSECISANKICGGYDLGNIFINMNSSVPTPVWTRSRNAQKYLVVDLASQPTPLPPSQNTPSELPHPSVVATMIQNPGNTPELLELFFDLYYRRFGPNKTSSVPLHPGKECGGWRSLLPHWVGQSQVLDTAIRALATCFIGAQYQDENMLNTGRDTYLSALQMMQMILSEPDSAQRRDLLATTLAMSSTELFLSNGGGASQVTHIEGANRLLHCMIDDAHLQNFEELHVYVMNQGLFECLTSRRSFIFSASCYRPLVRRLYSASPGYRSSLYFQWCELVMPLPNLLHSVDNLAKAVASGSTPSNPAEILRILDELNILDKTLAPWNDSLRSNIPGPWTFPAAITSPGSVPFPLQYVSVEACTLHCLHWASQLLIHDARHILTLLLSPHQIPVPTQDVPSQLAEYASLICRSIQFCTKGSSFASSECIFLPLSVAKSYYARTGDIDRKRWCQGAFYRISEEQKIGFSPERLESDY